MALMNKDYEIKDIEKKKPISKHNTEEVIENIQENVEENTEIKEKSEINSNNNKKQRHQK